MNEIGFTLGSFFGGLVFGAICWKFGAWLAGTMTRNPAAAALLGAVLSFWYATARDDTPSAWGAWIAFVLMVINSGGSKPPSDQ